MTNPFQSHPEYQHLVQMRDSIAYFIEKYGPPTEKDKLHLLALNWALEELPRLERALAEREAEDAR